MSGTAASFVDVPSVLIVLGGTLAVTLASFSFRDFIRMPLVVWKHLFHRHHQPSTVAYLLLDMADMARRKTILGLQGEAMEQCAEVPFFQKGLSMVIDGVDAEEVERALRQEIYAAQSRHALSVSVLQKMAEVAPAMGLIGTLIGLVQMLGNLNDPGSIGPAMALALLTTLYGAALAYIVFSPLASRLERNSAEEALIKTLCLRGVVSIAKQENPRRLEMLLNMILPPANRVQYFD